MVSRNDGLPDWWFESSDKFWRRGLADLDAQAQAAFDAAHPESGRRHVIDGIGEADSRFPTPNSRLLADLGFEAEKAVRLAAQQSLLLGILRQRAAIARGRRIGFWIVRWSWLIFLAACVFCFFLGRATAQEEAVSCQLSVVSGQRPGADLPEFRIHNSELITPNLPRAFDWRLTVADLGLTGMDIATSRALYRRGGRETWATWYWGRQPSTGRMLAQGLGTAALWQLLAWQLDKRGHRKLCRIIQWFRVGQEGAAVANNAVRLSR